MTSKDRKEACESTACILKKVGVQGGDKMLTGKQMQDIQDLKLRGYSINEIVTYYQEQGKKAPTLW